MANSTTKTKLMQLAALCNRLCLLLSLQHTQQAWLTHKTTSPAPLAASLMFAAITESNDIALIADDLVKQCMTLLQAYSQLSLRRINAPVVKLEPMVKVEHVESEWEHPMPSAIPSEPSSPLSGLEQEQDQECLLRILDYISSKARPDRFSLKELKFLAERMGSRRLVQLSWRGWRHILRKHGLEKCVRLK